MATQGAPPDILPLLKPWGLCPAEPRAPRVLLSPDGALLHGQSQWPSILLGQAEENSGSGPSRDAVGHPGAGKSPKPSTLPRGAQQCQEGGMGRGTTSVQTSGVGAC